MPERLRSSLVGVISGVAIESLCAAFGGEEVMLARGPARKTPIKTRIVTMLEAGATHSEAAREVGCTMKYSQMVAQNTDLKLTPRMKPSATRRAAERNA